MMTTTGGGTRPEAKAMNPTIASTPNWTFGAASGARRRVVVAISTHDAMTMAAQWRCIRSVPRNVPKRGPKSITRQPTPTKFPIKNGPEIIDFRPVL
jgi:hypothetical protein